MARANYTNFYSLPAAAAILMGQPLVVNTSGQFAIAGAGVTPHAIADMDCASGAQCRAVLLGFVVRGYAHGTIAVADPLTSDGTGWIKATTTGNQQSAIALTAQAAGKHFELLMTGFIKTTP